jgi:hypothetical protein
VEKVLGPPVDEVHGQDRQSYHVNFKVVVSLAVGPRRAKKQSQSPVAAIAPGKRRSPTRRTRAAVDKVQRKYFK